MLSKAIIIATKAHEGQVRKISGLPYIVHPLAVMQILLDYGYNDEKMLAAAVLHDVIEDCDEKYQEKILSLDEEVHAMVLQLTNKKTAEETNGQLFISCKRVQLVKMADIKHNTISSLGEKYVRKKIRQLTYLNKACYTILAEDTLKQLRSHL